MSVMLSPDLSSWNDNCGRCKHCVSCLCGQLCTLLHSTKYCPWQNHSCPVRRVRRLQQDITDSVRVALDCATSVEKGSSGKLHWIVQPQHWPQTRSQHRLKPRVFIIVWFCKCPPRHPPPFDPPNRTFHHRTEAEIGWARSGSGRMLLVVTTELNTVNWTWTHYLIPPYL